MSEPTVEEIQEWIDTADMGMVSVTAQKNIFFLLKKITELRADIHENGNTAMVIQATEVLAMRKKTALDISDMCINQQDKIKHTSHRDGLGMGCICCEGELASISTDIIKRFVRDATK